MNHYIGNSKCQSMRLAHECARADYNHSLFSSFAFKETHALGFLILLNHTHVAYSTTPGRSTLQPTNWRSLGLCPMLHGWMSPYAGGSLNRASWPPGMAVVLSSPC